MPLADEVKDKTAFVTPDGQFRFLYLPFGLVSAPGKFTVLMRKLFSEEPNVVSYIDDLLIDTITWEEHIHTVKRVLDILKEAILAARPSKCYFGFNSIDFLGHQVGQGSISTDPELLRKIQGSERPTTKKQVRSFLGLTGYYRRFVPDYASIAVPLNDLTKKGKSDKVVWDKPQEEAYQLLKKLLSSPPILKLPDFDNIFILRCDASNVGVGAMLMQEYEGEFFPVLYASRKLLPRECRYSTIEKKCLSIVWAVQKLYLFLFRREFQIQTDHKPLAYLQKAKTTNDRIMRWALYLQQFRYRIVSIPGNINVGPDFLSRVPGTN